MIGYARAVSTTTEPIMPSGTIFMTCEKCNRGYNLANPLVELTETGARCPHCGQPTSADEESMERALCERESQGECCG